MSKRKSKKSKNTMLIVFLVITFIIAIALLLYFFLWKENYGEIRENMSEEGEGKGYEQQCMDADNYRCKEKLTCVDKNEQGKGTCKCKNNETHISELSDEQKKFFERTECISNADLDIYNNDLGTKDGCDFISGVWDGSKCLPPVSKICKNNETHFSKLTDEQKPFFNKGECIPQNALEDLGEQEGCEQIFSGVWDGSKCLPPGTK